MTTVTNRDRQELSLGEAEPAEEKMPRHWWVAPANAKVALGYSAEVGQIGFSGYFPPSEARALAKALLAAADAAEVARG